MSIERPSLHFLCHILILTRSSALLILQGFGSTEIKSNNNTVASTSPDLPVSTPSPSVGQAIANQCVQISRITRGFHTLWTRMLLRYQKKKEKRKPLSFA